MTESKTAGCETGTPAVGGVKRNELGRCYIPPAGGALKTQFGDKLMVVIFSCLLSLFGTVLLVYLRECSVSRLLTALRTEGGKLSILVFVQCHGVLAAGFRPAQQLGWMRQRRFGGTTICHVVPLFV